MNYIDLPILGVYQGSEHLSFFAGPSIGIFLNGEMTIITADESGSDDIESKYVNSPDVSLVFGINYFFAHLLLDARYSYGLTNTLNEFFRLEDPEMRHSALQIMLGVGF